MWSHFEGKSLLHYKYYYYCIVYSSFFKVQILWNKKRMEWKKRKMEFRHWTIQGAGAETRWWRMVAAGGLPRWCIDEIIERSSGRWSKERTKSIAAPARTKHRCSRLVMWRLTISRTRTLLGMCSCSLAGCSSSKPCQDV